MRCSPASSVFWLWITVLFGNFAEAVAEGRGKAQADALRETRSQRSAKQLYAARLATNTTVISRAAAQSRRHRAGGSGRPDPRRRRGHRGRRLGRRIGDHRRIRAGDPRERAATARRSPAAPACSPTGSRSGSRPGRARRFLDRMISLVEGAKRQKTPNEIALDHPARGHDADLPARDGDHPEPSPSMPAARSPAIVLIALFVTPDPDHHRRAAVRDRHRRHGPAGEVQRARDVRTRGRGRGRRRHAAAGQDRHHHPRQPPGRRS